MPARPARRIPRESEEAVETRSVIYNASVSSAILRDQRLRAVEWRDLARLSRVVSRKVVF